MTRTILLAGLLAMSAGCGRSKAAEVVVYVSEDQVFSEPILRDFERETGIKVRTVYDTEEAKSTGVMNRLIAEQAKAFLGDVKRNAVRVSTSNGESEEIVAKGKVIRDYFRAS